MLLCPYFSLTLKYHEHFRDIAAGSEITE